VPLAKAKPCQCDILLIQKDEESTGKLRFAHGTHKYAENMITTEFLLPW
jgi:hypothetical protein